MLLLVFTAISPILSAAVDLSSPGGLWTPIDREGTPLGLIRIFER